METLLALVVTTAALVLIPGPNVALIVATSLRHGRRHGLLTVAGTTAGQAAQLAIVVAGLASLLEAAALALYWLKWAGAVYLLWLGVRIWREAPPAVAAVRELPVRTVWRGFLLALANPKTLLFSAAFLPQFLGTDDDAALRLPLLAAVFLGVVALGDSLWALCAAAVRPLLARGARLRQRLTGSLLIAAGLGLALANRSD